MPPPANLQPTTTPDRHRHHPSNFEIEFIPINLIFDTLKNRLSKQNCLIFAMQPSTENIGMGKYEYEESYIAPSQMAQSDGASCRVFFEPSQDNAGYIHSYSNVMHPAPPGLHAANHQGSIGHVAVGHQLAFPGQDPRLQGPMAFTSSSLGQLTAMPNPHVTQISTAGAQATLTSDQTGHLMSMPAGNVGHMAPAHPQVTGQALARNPTRAHLVAPNLGSGGEVAARPILINYIVFIRSAQNQAVGSSKATPSVKEWDRLASTAETVFKTDITRWDWPSLQARILSILEGPHDPIGLEGPGKLLRKHFDALADSGLLKWQCVLNSHRTYGHIGHYYVTCDEQWKVFVNVACHKENLAKKIFIKLLMDDPRKTVKAAESAKKQNNNLVAQYGTNPERIAMERLNSCLAKNTKADTDAKDRVQKVADLSTYICKKYGANSESLRIKDPDNPERSIRLTSNGLGIWGRALFKKADGVDFDRPPQTDDFVSEPITVFTRDEEAARVATPKTPKNKGPAKGAIRRSASLMASGNHKHGSPSGISPAAPRFTGVRKTPDGRIRPPKLIASPTLSLDPNDKVSSPSLGRPESINHLHVLGKWGSDASSVSKAPDPSGTDESEKVTDESAKSVDRGCSTTESDAEAEAVDIDPYVRGQSSDSTDIELVSGDQGGPGSHPSPARKIPRVANTSANRIAHTISRLEFHTPGPHDASPQDSPGNLAAAATPIHNGVAHTIGRLELHPPAPHDVNPVEQEPSGIQAAPPIPIQQAVASPTPGENGGPPAHEVAALEAETDSPPLNEAGRTLRMEDFLALCNFDANDMVPRVLIDVTHIRHWDFFRDTTVVELQRMGFPFPIAKQLIKGARGLEATHTQTNPPNAEHADTARPMI
ncbi:uncharacterized protein PGTG_05779 [Puccinia graminis f. sp. tritici CRL 75-36-700-3]|uniref:Uncharacterized protein n=1 Tax=Puccinia graminis f. sp. tritici (strain CRL 75-36-700-3 / race SCCL) TaxID=418459 RepID=E3K5K1_PUCGT|nr:uncharacterized protein PGTG_05779 [Puccinia graminis f. sp. tritici CRL 75-36-700-3]EFP79458.1 hypothetical protein PGTG_05779 [Puccinia graminis f. sp. tritici CRL 75-36-700-3]